MPHLNPKGKESWRNQDIVVDGDTWRFVDFGGSRIFNQNIQSLDDLVEKMVQKFILNADKSRKSSVSMEVFVDNASFMFGVDGLEQNLSDDKGVEPKIKLYFFDDKNRRQHYDVFGTKNMVSKIKQLIKKFFSSDSAPPAAAETPEKLTHLTLQIHRVDWKFEDTENLGVLDENVKSLEDLIQNMIRVLNLKKNSEDDYVAIQVDFDINGNKFSFGLTSAEDGRIEGFLWGSSGFDEIEASDADDFAAQIKKLVQENFEQTD